MTNCRGQCLKYVRAKSTDMNLATWAVCGICKVSILTPDRMCRCCGTILARRKTKSTVSNRTKIKTIPCNSCGKKFPSVHNMKYCTEKCKMDAWSKQVLKSRENYEGARLMKRIKKLIADYDIADSKILKRYASNIKIISRKRVGFTKLRILTALYLAVATVNASELQRINWKIKSPRHFFTVVCEFAPYMAADLNLTEIGATLNAMDNKRMQK